MNIHEEQENQDMHAMMKLNSIDLSLYNIIRDKLRRYITNVDICSSYLTTQSNSIECL